jgi:FtsH-binding integral membrane protein
MSYGLEYPGIAARAEPSARAVFIRRTYAHLAGAILAFVALETLLLQLPGIEDLVGVMLGGRLAWIVVLGAFVGVSWLAESWARSTTSPGLQYLGLGLYVVAQAIIFLPLLYIAKAFYPDAIPIAGILTLCIFGGLTVAVFATRRDFSFLGPILSIAFMLALGFIITALIFNITLGLVFCYVMVALVCGAILYNTSNVLFHYRTDQYVSAALALFASVALLFWYILQIVLLSRGRN